jgi:hypothetical protein
MFIIGKVVPVAFISVAFVPVIAVIGSYRCFIGLYLGIANYPLHHTIAAKLQNLVNGYYGHLSFTIGAHKKGSKAQALGRFR